MYRALAKALARSRPLHRDRLVTAMAKHLVAGEHESAEQIGALLDRPAYALARQLAMQLQHKKIEHAIARGVSRCFEMLRFVAARIRIKAPWSK